MDNVRVLVAGLEFNEFEQMRVRSDLYSLSDTFSFAGVILNTVNPFVAARTVKAGDRCLIWINSKLIMNGYVTDTRISSGDGTRFDFGGVDVCGWVSQMTAGKYVSAALTPTAIIAALREQIPALATVAISGFEKMPVLPDFQLNVGEQVSATLNTIADRTNTIFYALPSGQMVFGKKSRGGNYHNIIIGKHSVKKAVLTKDIKDICDTLVYFCEDADTGEIVEYPVKVPLVPQLGITRYQRVQGHPDEITGFAQKEANDIIARYLKMNAEVVGFTDAQHKVWEINRGAAVSDVSDARIYGGNLVVESVEFSHTRNEGQTTNLTLTLPAAY